MLFVTCLLSFSSFITACFGDSYFCGVLFQFFISFSVCILLAIFLCCPPKVMTVSACLASVVYRLPLLCNSACPLHVVVTDCIFIHVCPLSLTYTDCLMHLSFTSMEGKEDLLHHKCSNTGLIYGVVNLFQCPLFSCDQLSSGLSFLPEGLPLVFPVVQVYRQQPASALLSLVIF